MAEQKKASLQEKIANFVRSNRTLISIISLLVVVLIVATIVYTEVRRAGLERDAQTLYEAELAFVEWQESFDEENPEAGEVLTLFSEYSFKEDSYAWQRMNFLYAQVYEAMGELDSALEYYLSMGEGDNYLSSLALLKAGLLYEQLDNPAMAEETLLSVVERFESPEEPRILFTLGRLNESQENYAQALLYYNRLIDEYASSGWTNLAHTRIIEINIRNQVSN